MKRARTGVMFTAAALFAVAGFFAIPLGIEAESLLNDEDDPVAIADRGLDKAFDGAIAVREIEQALAADDADLAKSFVDLARDRNVTVPAALVAQVDAEVARANSVQGNAQSFARGLITGEPEDLVGLAGTALGDLFVFGDIRDAVREGTRYARGEQVDELVLGLAALGLAVTAGTYATFGASVPARVGISALKAARKTGRLSARMGEWVTRSLREVVDWSALRRAIGNASLAEPAVAVRAAREAVKANKADNLLKLAGDVGKVQTKAGTKAALDGLKVAQGPRDMAKVVKLAEAKGSKTRAILKVLGRGAIVLSTATLNLAFWIFGALATLWGFITSTKSGVERWTQRRIDRRKAAQRERYLAMVSSRF
jgi:hypothetical protein